MKYIVTVITLAAVILGTGCTSTSIKKNKQHEVYHEGAY